MGEGLGGCPACLPEARHTVSDGLSTALPLPESLLTMRKESRLTSQENIGLGYSNLQSGHGKVATLPIPMSGAMGNDTSPIFLPAALLTRSPFSREIKFGALFDNLPQGTQFLATGQFSPHLLSSLVERVTSRSLCTQSLPLI